MLRVLGTAHTGCIWHRSTKRFFCLSPAFSKKDKYSLKSIGKNSGTVRASKAPSFKRFGGSLEFPVKLYTLDGQRSEVFDVQKKSRHKSMIEHALQNAVENLICSGDVDERLAGCPIEFTKISLSDSFSAAKFYWKIDPMAENLNEADIEHLLSANIQFIRNILPAFHSMTHTPLVSFVRDNDSDRESLLEEAFAKITSEEDLPSNSL